MNHLNSILLEGVLVADPRQVGFDGASSDNRLVKFDIASDRYYLDKQGDRKVETLFIAVQTWGAIGEKCLARMRKGMTCRVVGRLRMARWVASDGTSRKSFEIVAEHVEFRVPRSQQQDGASEDMEALDEVTDYDRERLGEPEALYRI